MSPCEYLRLQDAVFNARSQTVRVFSHPPTITLPMYVSLGSVQLRCEAAAARCWPGSRAACLLASVTASRPLQLSSRSPNFLPATAAPLRLRHVGLGRAAYTAIR